jgi:hypothetical protein
MRARSGEPTGNSALTMRGCIVALCCGMTLHASALLAETAPSHRASGKPQQQTAPRQSSPPSTNAPASMQTPAPIQLPPLESLDPQERRTITRICAQEWEEMKRSGRSAGHHWKEFFESCRGQHARTGL